MVLAAFVFRLTTKASSTQKFSAGPRIFLRHFNRTGPLCHERLIRDRLVSFVESCPDAESLRKVHSRVFVSGLGYNIFVGSKLLNCYAKFGHLDESRRLFCRIINGKCSLWNSVLVGYFRSFQFGEVLKVYLELKLEGIGIDSSAITFGLKSCVEYGALELGRGIHVDSFKVGQNGDRFVGSALVGFYFGWGDVKDAERVFEEISFRDLVVYTAMITGYAQLANDYASEALRFVSYMQKEGFEPNRVTLISLLQAAGQVKAIREGRSIHGYAIRREMDHFDEVLETSIIGMYAKCGNFGIAQRTFTQIRSRSVASWNSLIAGFVQCEQVSEALTLFSLMVKENIEPDLITIAIVLMACVQLKCMLQGLSIHAHVIRRGADLDLVALTALIDLYCKCNQLDEAKILFNQMKERDVISYNVMIIGCKLAGSPDESILMFWRMLEEGIIPNTATMLNVLSACAEHADTRKGLWAHGYAIRSGFDSDIEVSNQILHIYAKLGHMDKAKLVFEMIRRKDLVSWTSLMMGYVNQGHPDKSLALYIQMQGLGFAPDSVSLLSLLQAFSQLGCLKHTKEVHGYLSRTGLDADFYIINSLIATYSECGRYDTSRKLFNNMRERVLSTWNTMIAAYGMHGQCRQALEFFHQMLNQNVEPDSVTFTSILSACSHAGLVEEGQMIFHFMKLNHRNAIRAEHYSCMVDMLGRIGFLKEAFKVAKSLPREQCSSALCSLLAACKLHNNAEMGETIGKMLVEINPESSGAYALLANIYAEAGKWSDVEKIRSLSKDRGCWKLPGYSMIQSEGINAGSELQSNILSSLTKQLHEGSSPQNF